MGNDVNFKGRLGLWTAAHFAVDFGCFLVLFGALRPVCMGGRGGLEVLTVGFLIYNIIAFGLQPVIGMLCDEKESWRKWSGWKGITAVNAGCWAAILSIQSAGWSLGPEEPVRTVLAWFAMIICALGNAAFHVGAGRDVLIHSVGRMKDNGIFVSSGALGVGLGTFLGSTNGIPALLGGAILLNILALILIKSMTGKTDDDHVPAAGEIQASSFHQAKDMPFLTAVILLFLVVVLRAFAGSSIPLEWERIGLLVLLPSAASCLGKALGGMAGDRFGACRTGVGSLLLSIPLIVFGAANPLLSLAGILLFNMTMPVTLCALVSLMPKNPGFAFGLTTLALLLGTMVTFFWVVPADFAKPVTAVLILLSAVCIGLTVTDEKGEK